MGWLAGLLLTAALVCWILARMTPAWYRPLDPDDQGVQDAAGRAQTLLYFDLRNAAERVPLGEQRWSISQDEANSFVAVNTAPPLTDDGRGRTAMDPARNPVSDPYIIFRPGEVTICVRATKLPGASPQGGVGSVTFSVGVVAGLGAGERMGLVKIQKVWAGYLPVPQSVVESRLQALTPVIVEAVLHMSQVQIGVKEMDKWRPIIEQDVASICLGKPFPLQYKVDKRDFIIKELTVEEGRFTIVLAPLKPAVVPPRPAPATQ